MVLAEQQKGLAAEAQPAWQLAPTRRDNVGRTGLWFDSFARRPDRPVTELALNAVVTTTARTAARQSGPAEATETGP